MYKSIYKNREGERQRSLEMEECRCIKGVRRTRGRYRSRSAQKIKRGIREKRNRDKRYKTLPFYTTLAEEKSFSGKIDTKIQNYRGIKVKIFEYTSIEEGIEKYVYSYIYIYFD